MVRCFDTWMLWDKGLVGPLIANISSRLKRNMRSKSIRKVEITLFQSFFLEAVRAWGEEALIEDGLCNLSVIWEGGGHQDNISTR